MENSMRSATEHRARGAWFLALAALLLAFAPPLRAQSCSGSNDNSGYILGSISNDGVAMHWETGLVWKRCRQGTFMNSVGSSCVALPGVSLLRSWNQWADSYLPAPFAASGSWGVSPGQPNRLQSGDWRLPYRQELVSLTTGCSNNPRINRAVFPDTPSAGFWSGSPDSRDHGYAWETNFLQGTASGIGRSNIGSARLVRGGSRFATLGGPMERRTLPNTLYVFPAVTLASMTSGTMAWGGLRVSGEGLPRFQVNGTGSWVTEAVVKSGDTITVRMMSGNGGTLRVATLELRSTAVSGTNATGGNGGSEPYLVSVTTAAYRAIAERICRVATDGSAANTGASWGSPMTLQKALDDDDPACDQVWVKRGVYTPGSNRLASFTINRRVRVYGGFAGNEGAVSQRNLTLNKSVLSGDIGGDDVRDERGITRRTEDIRGNNSYHVVTLGVPSTSNITSETVLDGLIITGGDANGPPATNANVGGGLYCHASNLGRNCSPTLNSLEFHGNHAAFAGGAIFAYANPGGTASPSIFGSRFYFNDADSGGALLLGAREGGVAAGSVRQTLFEGNTATTGGAVFHVAESGSNAQAEFVDNTFSGNTATNTGGAFLNLAGSGGDASPRLINSSFVGNHATHGGAVFSKASDADAFPEFTNCTFDGNQASEFGGAIVNNAVGTSSNWPDFYNVTLTGNTAEYGGAIADMSADGGFVFPWLFNTILWGNLAGAGGIQIHQQGAPVGLQIGYSIIQGGAAGIAGSNSAAFGSGEHNLNLDPQLAPLAANGGFTRTRMPAAGSPAVNAGGQSFTLRPCPATDQRGVARPQGASCDIGAVEQRPSEGHSPDLIFTDSFELL